MVIPDSIRRAIPEDEETKEIKQRIDDFKMYLKDENNTLDNVIDRYLLFGTPYLFRDNENKFFSLKSEIATHFGIKQTQIYIVGSAKLGFSISPLKRYKHFDQESDVDIAIIDSDLYLRFWKKLHVYMSNNSLRARSNIEESNFLAFKDYFFRGWLRPDKFPMEYRKEWFDFFNNITRLYDYPIAAGIYRDYDFFSEYHITNLKNLRKELLENVE